MVVGTDGADFYQIANHTKYGCQYKRYDACPQRYLRWMQLMALGVHPNIVNGVYVATEFQSHKLVVELFNQLAFLGYIDVILSEGFGRRSTNLL